MTALASLSPPTTISLRWYQQEAVDAIYRLLNEDDDAAPLVVLPTGSGKSYTGAEIARRWIAEHGSRVIQTIHVQELVVQNYSAVRALAPGLSAGIYSASVGRKDFFGQITVSNVQSIHRAADRFRNVGLLIIDEAHLLKHGESGQYHSLIRGLRANNPGLRVVGLTATPWRLSSGSLVEPYGDEPPLFNEIAFELSIIDLLAEGSLAPLVAKRTTQKMSTDAIKGPGLIKAGEYNEKKLDEAFNTEAINRAIVAETIAQAGERRSWLCFAITVDHATRLRDMFRENGVTCEVVTGETPKAERDRIIASYKAGRVRCLTNVMVLTTGFDAPATDCLILARPTMSPGLYLQMLGRAMRPAPGKLNALVLDFAGNVMKHGLADMVQGVRKQKKNVEPDATDSVKECVGCGSIVPKAARECPDCGMEFKSQQANREEKLDLKNLGDKVQSDASDVWWAAVEQATFRATPARDDKPAGMQLGYRIGVDETGREMWASEFLGFEHPSDSWPHKQARKIWRERSKTRPPATIDEAISRLAELSCPTHVRVRRNGQWLNVVGAKVARPANSVRA